MNNHYKPYKSLSEYMLGEKMEVDRFLRLALVMTQELYILHKQESKSYMLNPSKIAIASGKEIKVSFTFNNVVDEFYFAPEQIVTNMKDVSYSSDIYSLGLVFYEMLLGELPFRNSDPLERTHLLVARKIPSILEKEMTLSPQIAAVIEKMTSHNQDERYKDLLSVFIDLRKIQNALENHIQLDTFKPDTFKSFLNFDKDHMMYGRNNEMSKLQYMIDSQKPESNVVSILYGPSGVGKSSLLYALLQKNKSLFSHMIQFKLEQGEQSSASQILYKVLRQEIKQILMQDSEVLVRYRNKLQNILGTQAQALIEVIPEIEVLIGKQDIGTIGEKANLDTILVELLKLFLDKEKPLCLFIDDIQWTDNVTIDWIKNVILKLENIMLFMTYRDEEGKGITKQAFTSMLGELYTSGIKIEELDISLLSSNDIKNFIADSIELEETEGLSQFIYERTKGNPFFVKQYLKQLYSNNSIWFDLEMLCWKCDFVKMKKLQLSDNVFDMLSQSIDALDSDVRKLLCIASCMGNSFSYTLLQEVFYDDSMFHNALTLALSSGWIMEEEKLNNEKTFCFLHDKMQETMHGFLLGKMAQKVHYKIGCHLEKQREYLDKQTLLNCVNHLNIGSLYVRDKAFLSALNIEASMHAKKSGDFESALKYIKKAMELSLLNTSLDDMVMMLKLRAECEHLSNQSDEAILYYEKAIELSTNRLQKAEVYELLIKLYSDISQFEKAYEVGRVATKEFGINIPKSFMPHQFVASLLGLKFKLRNFKVEALIDLPPSEDEEFKMTIRLMANILQAAYQIRPELSVANAMLMVKLCLKHGLTKESVIGFTVFGVIFQGAILGNHTVGFEYSKLVSKMLEKFNNTIQHAEVKFVSGYFATSWKSSASVMESQWHEAYKNGLEIGDWFHTGCAAAGIIQSMFMRGVAFEELLKQIKYFEKVIIGIGAKEQHGAILSVKQSILNLTGQTSAPQTFDTQTFNEVAFLKSLETYNSKHFAHYYFINKVITLYIHEKYAEALQLSKYAKKFLKYSKGMLHETEYRFYHALISAQVLSEVNSVMRGKYKRSIRQTQKKFLGWANECKENFGVRSVILEGELFRLDGQYIEAFNAYDKAIDLANIYGQYHLSAIANRLMSQLYDVLEQYKAATLYRDASLENFHKWGMRHMIQIPHKYSNDLDIVTLIRASEVITKEHEFSSLLQSLIKIIMQNSGAQYAYLLLEDHGDFMIQASADDTEHMTHVMQNIDYLEEKNIVHPVVQYVLRTKEPLVIDDMSQNNIFESIYVSSKLVRSVLCAPLMLHGELKGVIYLENNLLSSVFTQEKVTLLQHLSGQIIISIENTMVYDNLEEKIRQRTKDLEASQEELKVLASTDPMTKLYNRRYFSTISDKIFSEAKSEENNIVLIMLDIDNFKNINDTYGHHIGDKVIIAIAEILKENTRKSDIVSRYGGEEYMILLAQGNVNTSMKIAEKIRELVSQLVIELEDERVLRTTISIGISETNTLLDSQIEIAINKADNALYEAKRSGKNKVVVYSRK